MGDPLPARQVVRIPQPGCGIGPLTRLPLPSHAAAAACPDDTCPASRSARRPSCAAPDRGTTSDSSSVPHETPRHGPLPPARPTGSSGPRGLPRAAGQWPLGKRPPSRANRDVALGALAARRPRCRAFAAGHIGHLPVPPLTPDVPPGDAPWGASDCGALYHAVINPALPAFLADPAPPLAWRPLPPPVTTPLPSTAKARAARLPG